MAGNYAVGLKDEALDFIGTKITHVSAHSADPGATGANELTGGTPAYARIPVTWSVSSGGILVASTPPTFNIPAGSWVRYLGLWNALTGGTWRGKILVPEQEFLAQTAWPVASLALDLNAVASA
ncbi:MAG TPA: hypothetical protein VFP72_04560 [Kineosporiaceae bacterium]|nr:hypothetical protein [Kineosporiaceae bacterium]